MKKGILVVDDDLDLLFCYELMLENENTVVFTSNDVKEAQEIVKREKIDLVILDYIMPKLRGDQLAQRIYEINNKIKIIFVSGYTEVVDAVKKLDIRVHGVFMKPINPEIMEKIAESEDLSYLNQHSYDMHALNVYSNAQFY
jgi:DNA-binding NtrC family response regulator